MIGDFRLNSNRRPKRLELCALKMTLKTKRFGSEKSEFGRPVKSYCRSVHMMVIA